MGEDGGGKRNCRFDVEDEGFIVEEEDDDEVEDEDEDEDEEIWLVEGPVEELLLARRKTLDIWEGK